MTVKSVVQTQYRRLADSARKHAGLTVPPEGWLRTMRAALGMSGSQLGTRLGVTRARVSQAEQGELAGTATLKSMKTAAEAMGCTFVYALVPKHPVQEIIENQALVKARTLVRTASTHMAFEEQLLPGSAIEQEIKRLAEELTKQMPPDLWSDT